jgi:hypothetical protein
MPNPYHGVIAPTKAILTRFIELTLQCHFVTMPFHTTNSCLASCLVGSNQSICPRLNQTLPIVICFALLGLAARGEAIVVTNAAGLSAALDSNGSYTVQSSAPAWTFGGEISSVLKNTVAVSGEDSLGGYQRISFEWTEGSAPISGEIRLYNDRPVILFSEQRQNAGEMPPSPFPSFTKMPKGLHVFSYQQQSFAPPQFAANECSTPWLLFDDHANALVISPASHFMVASMIGDAVNQMASGFNPQLRNLPAGFSQQTMLAFGDGINRAWDLWGQSLRTFEGAGSLHKDADATLKYLGYWTDNGASLYYNFDPQKGYAGTLVGLVEHYRQRQIPIRYLQLDSWWYYKSATGADDRTVAGTKNPAGKKNPNMPDGEWNRYGGLLEYKAHPYVFPEGLEAFQKSVGLPLVTHNRWIDSQSPYHQKYAISGVAAVDPKWWDDIADYLHQADVQTYEQDWLYSIYQRSPAFSSNLYTAEIFLDNMARACKERGMTMQYCMPYPAHFLQGSRYDNLTSIRTSFDRFGRNHWPSFLYTSRLAYSMGIRPWSDVFNSTETDNLLLSTLSSGPVGIGDALGHEDKGNLFQAVRADGVIVKPDVPALPLDCSYITAVQGGQSPLIAAAYTEHGDFRTAYLFAFNQASGETNEVHFIPADLGFSGPVYVYNYFTRIGQRLEAGQVFSAALSNKAVAYYMVTSIDKNGMAFLGDEGKFVSNGKQRISSLKDDSGEMIAEVQFARSEKSIRLHGYSATAPNVTVKSGEAGPVQFDLATGRFAFELRVDLQAPLDESRSDPTRQVTVTLKSPTNKLAADLDGTLGR